MINIGEYLLSNIYTKDVDIEYHKMDITKDDISNYQRDLVFSSYVLNELDNEDIPNSIEENKQLLKKHNIALYDVIYSCDTINSSDSFIKNVTPINIKELLDKYHNINTIIVNGNKAKELFNKYLLKDIDLKKIDIEYAPSTSSANAKMSLEELAEIYKQFII